jgi:hypothetical protein
MSGYDNSPDYGVEVAWRRVVTLVIAFVGFVWLLALVSV